MKKIKIKATITRSQAHRNILMFLIANSQPKRCSDVNTFISQTRRHTYGWLHQQLTHHCEHAGEANGGTHCGEDHREEAGQSIVQNRERTHRSPF